MLSIAAMEERVGKKVLMGRDSELGGQGGGLSCSSRRMRSLFFTSSSESWSIYRKSAEQFEEADVQVIMWRKCREDGVLDTAFSLLTDFGI